MKKNGGNFGNKKLPITAVLSKRAQLTVFFAYLISVKTENLVIKSSLLLKASGTLATIVKIHTSKDMAYDWALFLNEEFHPTFQKELSRQLFEKGNIGTRFKDFDKLDFQIIIGIHDLEIRQSDNKMFAKIDFITPGSYSIPVEIFWTAKNSLNLSGIHKNDISKMNIEINWGENFPYEEILPWMMIDPE